MGRWRNDAVTVDSRVPVGSVRVGEKVYEIRRHYSRKELLQVAIHAADAIFSRAKRGHSATLRQKAMNAAFDAIRIVDPMSGTNSHAHRVNYSHGVSALAKRGVDLAARRHFAPHGLTADYRRDPDTKDLLDWIWSRTHRDYRGSRKYSVLTTRGVEDLSKLSRPAVLAHARKMGYRG